MPQFILFLPFFACVFSLVVHFKLAPRASAFKEFFALYLATAVFLFAQTTRNLPGIPPYLLVWSTLLAMLSAPATIPMLIIFFQKVRDNQHRPHPFMMLWMIIPVLLFFIGLICYYLADATLVEFLQDPMRERGFEIVAGRGNTALELYYMVLRVVFRWVMIIEIAVFAIYIIVVAIKEKYNLRNAFLFYFKGQPILLSGLLGLYAVPAYLLIIARILFFTPLLHRPVLSLALDVTLAAFIVEFAYVALFSSKKTVLHQEMSSAMRYNYNHKNKAVIVESMLDSLLDDAEEDALRRIQEKITEDLQLELFRSKEPSQQRSDVIERVFSAVSQSWDEENLLPRFQQLMRDEQLFLQPRLSLDDVADRLGTNKFYVSKLVNNAYNLGFPELINTLRIDYAEQYILNNRDVKQEVIARECGFVSASSFNTTFKKITGLTPKVWIASRQPK